MVSAKLYFQINLKYQSKLYEPLNKLGTHKYNMKLRKWQWTFPLSKNAEVMAVISQRVRITKLEADLANSLVGQNGTSIIVGAKQGIGFVKVSVSSNKPSHFKIIHVRERSPTTTYVPFSTVEALWSVLKKQPRGKKVLTHTIAENYCNKLGIVSFNIGKNGQFSARLFNGTRQVYLKFWAAIKVLEHYSVAEHIIQASKSGIKRTADKWEIQHVLGDEKL